MSPTYSYDSNAHPFNYKTHLCGCLRLNWNRCQAGMPVRIFLAWQQVALWPCQGLRLLLKYPHPIANAQEIITRASSHAMAMGIFTQERDSDNTLSWIVSSCYSFSHRNFTSMFCTIRCINLKPLYGIRWSVLPWANYNWKCMNIHYSYTDSLHCCLLLQTNIYYDTR